MNNLQKASTAPSSVGFLRGQKLARQGRKDANKYVGLNDHTRTHALLAAQAHCQAGQHAVNIWLIESAKQYLTGNARIEVEGKRISDEILLREKTPGDTGRAKKATQLKVSELRQQLTNLQAQYVTNNSLGSALMLAAEESLGAWAAYFDQLAGVYTRARARKSKRAISAVGAEVPVFEAIPISQIPDFALPVKATIKRTSQGEK